MCLPTARKLHKCNGYKGCGADIFIGFKYQPQRRGKKLCIDCAKRRSSDAGFKQWVGSKLNRLIKYLES